MNAHSRVREIEHLIDQAYLSSPLIQQSRELATFYVLTAYQNLMNILRHPSRLFSDHEVWVLDANLRYALHRALRWITTTCESAPFVVPRKPLWDQRLHEYAQEFIELARHYWLAEVAYIAYSRGWTTAQVEGSKVIFNPIFDYYRLHAHSVLTKWKEGLELKPEHEALTERLMPNSEVFSQIDVLMQRVDELTMEYQLPSEVIRSWMPLCQEQIYLTSEL
jgi:hypothetical protein